MLWYKDDDGEPIYTYDARTDSQSPSHWSEDQPRGFGPRARLVISPHPAQLGIENIVSGDAGVYRSRMYIEKKDRFNKMIGLINP